MERIRIEPVTVRVVITLAEEVIADSTDAVRVVEAGQPPVYYLPRAAFAEGSLFAASGERSDAAGLAQFLSIRTADVTAQRAAWSYPDPRPGYEALAGRVAVHPEAVDSVEVDGAAVTW